MPAIKVAPLPLGVTHACNMHVYFYSENGRHTHTHIQNGLPFQSRGDFTQNFFGKTYLIININKTAILLLHKHQHHPFNCIDGAPVPQLSQSMFCCILYSDVLRVLAFASKLFHAFVKCVEVVRDCACRASNVVLLIYSQNKGQTLNVISSKASGFFGSCLVFAWSMESCCHKWEPHSFPFQSWDNLSAELFCVSR